MVAFKLIDVEYELKYFFIDKESVRDIKLTN